MAGRKAASKRSSPKVARKSTRAAPAGKATKSAAPGRVVVENVNVPTSRRTVDAAKYEAMRRTLLAVLPAAPPGLTQAEMFDAATRRAPAAHFPGGEKVAWWAKTVQLDLEAKGIVRRGGRRPVRWWRG